MNEQYIVGLSYENGAVALTLRCLERNKHFKRNEGNPNCIFNSQEENPKMFAIIFEGCKTDARNFYAAQRLLYKGAGIAKSFVKEEADDE
jgi:hypothetical protein